MDTTTRQALGLIESWGHVPLIAALDAAIKAAQISLASSHLTGGGLSTAIVRGDVGAVNAAISAAQASFRQTGARGMTHIIARPDSSVWAMLKKDGLKLSNDPLPAGGSGSAPARAAALKAEVHIPAVRVTAEVPAVKVEAAPPAVKVNAEVPTKRAETQPPVAQPLEEPGQNTRPSPEAEPIEGDEHQRAKAKKIETKTRCKVRKPRKK